MNKNFFFLILLLMPGDLYALPEGGNVIAGGTTIGAPSDGRLEITQTTDRAIINWNQFNIAENEAVSFMQPGLGAVTLNRVTGADPSSILGTLTANGSLFFVNPHGIYFGPTATLDVGGLVATTLDIENTDFLAGRYLFHKAGDPVGEVANNGKIVVRDGGFAFLVAPSVANEGVILARLGKVVMGSVEQFRVDFDPTGGVSFVVDETVLDRVYDPNNAPLAAQIQNGGTISAEGGEVVLIAKGASEIISSVINQSGIIEAKSLVNHGGRILLMASDPVANTGVLGAKTHLHEVQNATGIITQGGTLNVSAAEPGAEAGEITLSGKEINVTGTLLAQGTAEGGRVLVTSSEETVVTKNAMIDTSGIGNANAGNVVIWSDNKTGFAGTLLAKGGQEGGNGGQIEVSGFEQLGYGGTVDAGAVAGDPGSLLLDPENIVITHGEAGSLPANPLSFGDNPGGLSSIDADAITAVTNGGTGVILQANNDITVNEAIQTNNPHGKGGSLTMHAGRSILIKADIISDDAEITFIANHPAAGSTHPDPAEIIMATGTTLNAGLPARDNGSNINITLDAGLGPSGDIRLGNLVTSSNIKVIHAGTTGDVSQHSGSKIDANSASFDIRGTGSIGRDNNAPIQIHVKNLEARSQTGGIFFQSDQNVIVGDVPPADPTISGIQSKGQVSIAVTGNLTISEAITSGGEITLTALGTGNKISNATTITGPSHITLRADRMDIKGAIESTGSGLIILRPDTPGRGIDLGSETDMANVLELSENEINKITTTGMLQIGSKESGAITIIARIKVPSIGTLALQSNSKIDQRGELVTPTLHVEALGPIILDHADNNLDTISANVTSPGKEIIVANSDDLTLGNTVLGAAMGVTTNNGSVTITTTAGDVVVQNNLQAGSAAIMLTAGGTENRLTNNAEIQGHGIVLEADQMVLAGESDSAIHGGSGRVTLQPNTPDRSIDLGVTNDPEKILALSDPELDTIKTTGTLQIGDTKTDAITISSPINTANVETVMLTGKGPITQISSAPIVEERLRIQSDEKVLLTDPNNNIGVITVTVTDPGQTVSVRDIDGVQIGSVDGAIGIQTQGGAIDVQGRITLAGAIEERFQSDVSRFPDPPFGGIYLDIVTSPFVVSPPCTPDRSEGISINETCR